MEFDSIPDLLILRHSRKVPGKNGGKRSGFTFSEKKPKKVFKKK
jgi:hypothetical protein